MESAAPAATQGFTRQAPTITRNSPTKLERPGRPTEAMVKNRNTSA